MSLQEKPDMEEHVPPHNGLPLHNQPFTSPNTSASNIIPLTSIGVRPAPAKELDIAAVRARLAGSSGQEFWRSLDELADTQEFRELIEREFPRQAPASWAPLERREFLKLMGVGLAMAGLSGCAMQPAEKIVPYVKQPEDIVPGKPLFFATAITHGGFARGLLVESHMGRPTKIEGNPDHPASLGRTDATTQAALYTLYDPNRSQQVVNGGSAASWSAFTSRLLIGDEGEAGAADQPVSGGAAAGNRRLGRLAALRANRGRGLRILTETVTSPTLAAQIRAVQTRYPEARWHQWDAEGRDNVRAGARLAFGTDVNTIYRFDRAERILSLDSDFLMEEPGSVRYAHEFIDGRRVRSKKMKWERSRIDKNMNRLYVAESTPTLTGAMADHRLPMRASEIEAFARWVQVRLAANGVVTSPDSPPAPATGEWVNALIADLQAHRGRSLVIAGDHQSPAVHALAHAINAALGNVGTTVLYTEPVEASPTDQMASLSNLVKDMKAGTVDTLVILGGNPVYTAPADLDFRGALEKLSKNKSKLTVHLGEYFDETGQWCQWHIPQSHFLETWSDARAFDGTVSLVQPLITPMYESRTAHEVLAVLLGQLEESNYHIVRNFWRTQPAFAGGDFETKWRTALNNGVIPNTAARPRAVRISPLGAAAIAATAAPASAQSLEINFRLAPHIRDGRYANNAWLQELPQPITTITWDNAVLVSPKTAEELGLKNEDVVALEYSGRKLEGPVWILPGHPQHSVTVHLGYGRERAGQIGSGVGFNAYNLRTSQAPWFGSGLKITRTGSTHLLATTQQHHLIDKVENGQVDSMHRRQPVRLLTIQDYASGNVSHDAHGGSGHGGGDPKATQHGANATTKHGAPDDKAAEGHATKSDHANTKSAAAHGATGEEAHTATDIPHGEEAPQTSIYTDEWPSDTQSQQPGGTTSTVKIPHQWGMVIDLNACIGCHACTMGCQVENNIPVVGKDEVSRGREMHWIRIDRYYQGSIDDPGTYFQPLPCMHCEKAPCEPVCPVQATSHSAEGINEQTYNRCVGTKYCSNNCPYKVRRFNFLQYSEQDSPTIMLMQNPDVTVRARGVMEKCTFCIQRINDARIRAEKRHGNSAEAADPNSDYKIRDGEVTTACAQVCPTDAISFGNIMDKESKVATLKAEPLNYVLLDELNTRPRTSYLNRLRNPNPVIKTGANTNG